jgi:hypothetical protein
VHADRAIAHQRVPNLITPMSRLRLGFDSRRQSSRLDDLEKRLLDSIIDPQAAEGDAARLAVVEPSARTQA